MDRKTKKSKTLVFKNVLIAYWLLFPFGQLIRIPLIFYNYKITIHPPDVVAAIALILFFSGLLKTNKTFVHVLNFLLICVFSLVLSLAFFSLKDLVIGFLYLLRFFSYSTLFLLVANLTRLLRRHRKLILDGLIYVTVVIAIFGCIQYIFIPDLRFLFQFGWDDHLNRLAGSFLDPGFTGILLVLGLLIILSKYIKKPKIHLLIPIIFVIITIALTYSRASYLSLMSGFFVMARLYKKYSIIALFSLLLIFTLVLLPKGSGEGVRLERTFSIFAKINNYRETFILFKESPLFGVGFNNICFARNKILSFSIADSHSCSGSDSSIMFILATTGVSGLLVFFGTIFLILKNIKHNLYFNILIASCASLFVHSLFVHSMFYPWVMGWMATITGLSVRKKRCQ